ncbi:MAG: hypothetical protein IPJ41_09230 [Phycisphaerales bacterium]|nr:hypothetical protein [Phycisphaerales bacterium]
MCAWEAYDASVDPFTGHTEDPEHAHLFRLDLTFRGLVNPPGPLGLNGDPFDPYAYGPSPVVGFLDLDVDDEHDTGGELGAAAEIRYLANVGRFGRRPYGSLGDRAAASRGGIDGDFYTSPQYERSGADFSLVLCGCFTPTVLVLDGDGDGLFEVDERWLVTGRFFERAQGYRDASAAFNGSAPGLYDPMVTLLFENDSLLGVTTVSLVWALDPTGAAEMAGAPVEPIDLDVSNQNCLAEALSDIIDGANGGGISGPAWTLVKRWAGESPWPSTDVSNWGHMTGLFGMPYSQSEATLYAWTDTLGEEQFADLNGDALADNLDESLVRSKVYADDGTTADSDGLRNGTVTLPNPGWNFDRRDTDGDMRIDLFDQRPYGPLGDFNNDNTVDIQDFIAFLNAWAARQPSADFNLDNAIDIQDFIAFLNAWVGG